MTSCDVIKLASRLEQGKAMHGRPALLTPLARTVSRVCARACGGSAGAVHSFLAVRWARRR